MDYDRIALIIVGVAAAIVQLLLGPALTFGDFVPNFIVAAVVAVVVAAPDEPHYLFAFVMGLVADFLGSSPVGSTAACLLLCAWALPMLVETVGSDNIIMVFIIMFAGMLGIQLVLSLFLLFAGFVGFIDALAHIVLPCTPYNAIIALVLYLVVSRFTTGRPMRGGTTMTNIRFN